MKKRKLLTLVSCILIVVLAVSAASAAISPRYTYIKSTYTELTINQSGLSNCYSITETSTSTHTISVNVELQKRSGSGSWQYVKDWDTSGSLFAELDKSWYVLSGYEYRAKTTIEVYSGSTRVETVTEYSNIVKY